MEKLIKNFPDIISIDEYSEILKFSFSEILSYFNEQINSISSDYYFLINPSQSLFYTNEKLGINNIMINEIIDLIYNINSKHNSTLIKIFCYKKYVKQIAEIKGEEVNITKDKLLNLIAQNISYNEPQTDILISLTNLYSKIEKSLTNKKHKKNKILKIIIINSDKEEYKKINEKNFEPETLTSILKEFLSINFPYIGVEFKYFDEKLIKQKIKGFEKISDQFILTEKSTFFESIINSDELLKTAEKINFYLYRIWEDIITDEIIKNWIIKFDNLLNFYKSVINAIIVKMKKNKDDKVFNYFITSQNLKDKKDEILSNDINDTLFQEISIYKDKVKEIKVGDFFEKINKNKKFNNCLCWIEINNFLIKQENDINQFLLIIENSTKFFKLFEKEILKINKGKSKKKVKIKIDGIDDKE